MAQIKLLSASNEVQWSPEEYVIARTLTIAGGQYVVRERKKTGHVFESDLRPSELICCLGGEGGIALGVCAQRVMWL